MSIQAQELVSEGLVSEVEPREVFMEPKELSDFTIVYMGCTYHLHSQILCRFSKMIHTTFQRMESTSRGKKRALDPEDSLESVFKRVDNIAYDTPVVPGATEAEFRNYVNLMYVTTKVKEFSDDSIEVVLALCCYFDSPWIEEDCCRVLMQRWEEGKDGIKVWQYLYLFSTYFAHDTIFYEKLLRHTIKCVNLSLCASFNAYKDRMPSHFWISMFTHQEKFRIFLERQETCIGCKAICRISTHVQDCTNCRTPNTWFFDEYKLDDKYAKR
jgi:hypothetical protein